MKGIRASILLAATVSAAAALPVAAQVEDGIVLNIMRECARIDDATSRLACYDNNIRAAGGQVRASVPGRMERPTGGGAAPAGAAGFGGEDVRTARSAGGRESGGDALSSQVARVDPPEPGIYVLTLADGARWQLTDGVEPTGCRASATPLLSNAQRSTAT